MSVLLAKPCLLCLSGVVGEDARNHGFKALQTRLDAYYNRRRLLDEESRTYEIFNLTPEMVSQGENPQFKGKASETRCMLDFVYELLLEFGPRLGDAGRFLTIAATSMRETTF